MPGVWEIVANDRILLGILHVDFTSIAWSLGLRNLILPGRIMPVAGMPFDHARNLVCGQALQQGFSHVGFLDSDVIAPRDAFLRLLAHDKPIVSGTYCRRSPPHAVPVMMKNGNWVTHLPAPGEDPLIEVDVVGAGCLLIQRQVLEKLPPSRPEAGKLWFDWKVDMGAILPPGEALSEDFAFCRHAKRHLGHPILVDTSIRCKHVGFARAEYGSYLPCEADPNT